MNNTWRRYTVEQNLAGGWELRDTRTGAVVASSAFREFVEKAKSRLAGVTSWTIVEAKSFYGIETKRRLTVKSERDRGADGRFVAGKPTRRVEL